MTGLAPENTSLRDLKNYFVNEYVFKEGLNFENNNFKLYSKIFRYIENNYIWKKNREFIDDRYRSKINLPEKEVKEIDELFYIPFSKRTPEQNERIDFCVKNYYDFSKEELELYEEKNNFEFFSKLSTLFSMNIPYFGMIGKTGREQKALWGIFDFLTNEEFELLMRDFEKIGLIEIKKSYNLKDLEFHKKFDIQPFVEFLRPGIFNFYEDVFINFIFPAFFYGSLKNISIDFDLEKIVRSEKVEDFSFELKEEFFKNEENVKSIIENFYSYKFSLDWMMNEYELSKERKKNILQGRKMRKENFGEEKAYPMQKAWKTPVNIFMIKSGDSLRDSLGIYSKYVWEYPPYTCFLKILEGAGIIKLEKNFLFVFGDKRLEDKTEVFWISLFLEFLQFLLKQIDYALPELAINNDFEYVGYFVEGKRKNFKFVNEFGILHNGTYKDFDNIVNEKGYCLVERKSIKKKNIFVFLKKINEEFDNEQVVLASMVNEIEKQMITKSTAKVIQKTSGEEKPKGTLFQQLLKEKENQTKIDVEKTKDSDEEEEKEIEEKVEVKEEISVIPEKEEIKIEESFGNVELDSIDKTCYLFYSVRGEEKFFRIGTETFEDIPKRDFFFYEFEKEEHNVIGISGKLVLAIDIKEQRMTLLERFQKYFEVQENRIGLVEMNHFFYSKMVGVGDSLLKTIDGLKKYFSNHNFFILLKQQEIVGKEHMIVQAWNHLEVKQSLFDDKKDIELYKTLLSSEIQEYCRYVIYKKSSGNNDGVNYLLITGKYLEQGELLNKFRALKKLLKIEDFNI